MTSQIQNPIRFGRKFMSTGENVRTYTVTGIDDGYGIVYTRSEPGEINVKMDRKRLEQMFQNGIMIVVNT